MTVLLCPVMGECYHGVLLLTIVYYLYTGVLNCFYEHLERVIVSLIYMLKFIYVHTKFADTMLIKFTAYCCRVEFDFTTGLPQVVVQILIYHSECYPAEMIRPGGIKLINELVFVQCH